MEEYEAIVLDYKSHIEYFEDDSVIFVAAAVDHNPDHGSNDEAEMDV